jgi:hypothetical protein
VVRAGARRALPGAGAFIAGAIGAFVSQQSVMRYLGAVANCMLRRYLPRSTDLSTLDQAELTDICEELNDRPMAVLGYRTPREVLHSALGLSVALHL